MTLMLDIQFMLDRKSVVQGKSVDLGGRRIIKKKKKREKEKEKEKKKKKKKKTQQIEHHTGTARSFRTARL